MGGKARRALLTASGGWFLGATPPTLDEVETPTFHVKHPNERQVIMGRVFRQIQSRVERAGGPVGVHTMLLAVIAYLGEVNRFLLTVSQPAESSSEAVIEEWKNFEEMAGKYLRSRR